MKSKAKKILSGLGVTAAILLCSCGEKNISETDANKEGTVNISSFETPSAINIKVSKKQETAKPDNTTVPSKKPKETPVITVSPEPKTAGIHKKPKSSTKKDNKLNKKKQTKSPYVTEKPQKTKSPDNNQNSKNRKTSGTKSPEQTKSPANHQDAKETIESYYGILIDEDCSDFEDPPAHDLPCMLMYECRASGYGLDILQDDGSYKFYMFDEKGQQLAWEYLNKTTRMSGLYVTVTGVYENGVIKVKTLKES